MIGSSRPHTAVAIVANPPGFLNDNSSGPGDISGDDVHPLQHPVVIISSAAIGDSNKMVLSKRSQSAQSSLSTTSSQNGDMCRICHCEATSDMPLIMPCYCSGTLKFVHQKCLQQWIKSSQTRSCEVCRYNFHMTAKMRPFSKMTFHVVAVAFVVWSLYVLIDRTAAEIIDNNLGWPFWTKLVVVGVGCSGGVAFFYVQCKLYVALFRRWKAYNKVIYVQNCPETKEKPGVPSGLASLDGSKQKLTPTVDVVAQPTQPKSGSDASTVLTIMTNVSPMSPSMQQQNIPPHIDTAAAPIDSNGLTSIVTRA